MFAGSCIGVVCLVIALEMLRRLGRIYERYLVRQAKAHRHSTDRLEETASSDDSSKSTQPDKAPASVTTHTAPLIGRRRANLAVTFPSRVHLTLSQQTLRALLHMVQFGLAYFIMLLAMYYNGYFIICILLGAFLGFFAFGWDTVNLTTG